MVPSMNSILSIASMLPIVNPSYSNGTHSTVRKSLSVTVIVSSATKRRTVSCRETSNKLNSATSRHSLRHVVHTGVGRNVAVGNEDGFCVGRLVVGDSVGGRVVGKSVGCMVDGEIVGICVDSGVGWGLTEGCGVTMDIVGILVGILVNRAESRTVNWMLLFRLRSSAFEFFGRQTPWQVMCICPCSSGIEKGF